MSKVTSGARLFFRDIKLRMLWVWETNHDCYARTIVVPKVAYSHGEVNPIMVQKMVIWVKDF